MIGQPTDEEMLALLGADLYPVWRRICQAIDERYDMERVWDKGYRDWVYEYKYRRGGKTLCTLYAKSQTIGLQIIFGKDERAKLEAERSSFSQESLRIYDQAATFHDGKWVMYLPTDDAMLPDWMKMLCIKRRPNKKK